MERLQAFGFPLQIDCHKQGDGTGKGTARKATKTFNTIVEWVSLFGLVSQRSVSFCFLAFWWHGQGNWSSLIRYSQDGKLQSVRQRWRWRASDWRIGNDLGRQASECLAICCHYWPINFDVHLTMMIGSGGRNDFAFESVWESPRKQRHTLWP